MCNCNSHSRIMSVRKLPITFPQADQGAANYRNYPQQSYRAQYRQKYNDPQNNISTSISSVADYRIKEIQGNNRTGCGDFTN